jgi:hypothetical protein
MTLRNVQFELEEDLKVGKGYKEDSTKGTALVLPKSYKGDVLVQVWIDSRVLATLSMWLDSEGNYTRFMSEIVKDTLTMLCERLVEDEIVELVDDTANARNMLERKYRVNLNPCGRGKRNVLHNKVLSSHRETLAKDIRGKIARKGPVMAHTSMNKKRVVSQEELDRLVGVYNSLGEQDIEEVKSKAIKAAQASGAIVEERPVLREGASDVELEEYEEHQRKKDEDQLKLLNQDLSEEDIEYMKKEGLIVEKDN